VAHRPKQGENMTQIPVQPAPEWRLQPVQIALIDLSGNALIGAKLTLAPDSKIPVEIVGVDGPITVFPTELGPFASVPGVLNGTAVGMIETNIPVSSDPVVNSELTYTGTLEWPGAGGFVKATVCVDDIADDGVLWIGPSFVAGTLESGTVSPDVTYASFASLQQAVLVLEQAADAGGTVTASTANLLGTGQTGQDLMESATPAVALTALALSPWSMTETSAGSGVFSLDGEAFTTPTGELVGIGSPVGAVTAYPGSIYTDTAGTTGAWRWIKTSGTGNTGWTVQYGDTGWRNIGTIAGVTESIKIRRLGASVYISSIGESLTTSSLVTNGTMTAPAGFMSSARTEMLISTNGTIVGRFMVKPLAIAIYVTVTSLAEWCSIVGGQWVTADAWPTILPGTAA